MSLPVVKPPNPPSPPPVDITSLFLAPTNLSPSNPLLSTPTFSLASAMTALEVGCPRCDLPIPLPPTVSVLPPHITLNSLPTLLMSNGTSTPTPPPPVNGAISPYEIFSKVLPRLTSWLAGSHSLAESLYTYTPPPNLHPPLSLSTTILSHFVDVVRDTVWFADVYEEEDICISGYRRGFWGRSEDGASVDDQFLEEEYGGLCKRVGEWEKEESTSGTTSWLMIQTCWWMLRGSYVMRCLRDVDLLHAIDLQTQVVVDETDVDASSATFHRNITFLIDLLTHPPSTSASITAVTAANPVPLPPPTPEPVGTTYTSVTTSTFADPPHFQPTLLHLTTNGAPTRACQYPPTETAYHYLPDLLTTIKTQLLVPLLTSHPLSLTHVLMMYAGVPDCCVVVRSLFANVVYSRRGRLVGTGVLPVVTSNEVTSCGVAVALARSDFGVVFCDGVSRMVYERVRRLCWNGSRRRDMCVVANCGEVLRGAREADGECGRRLGLEGCSYMQTAASIFICDVVLEHLRVTGSDKIAADNGYDCDVFEWLCEYYGKAAENSREAGNRAREALEKAKWEGEVERDREAWEEEQAAAKAKAKAKGGKKKGKKGATPVFVAKPMDFYITEEEKKLKLLQDVQGLFGCARLYCHRGTFRLIEGLKAHGVMTPTTYVYTTCDVVYDRTYAKLTEIEYPPRPSYSDYLEGSVSYGSDNYKCEDLCRMAVECYQKVLTVLEQLAQFLDDEFRAELEPLMRFDAVKGEMKEIKRAVVMNKLEIAKVGKIEKGVRRRVVVERRKEAGGLGVVKVGDVVA